MDKLIIGNREFSSRLFVGTGKFPSNELMLKAILASESEMITVAMKRINMDNEADDDMLRHINRDAVQFLPNTSGVRNAEEAVFAAQMAREAFGTNWLKLEIHPDPRYLLPDSVETLKATEQLVKLGFVVLPYCQADPTLCKHLEDMEKTFLCFFNLITWQFILIFLIFLIDFAYLNQKDVYNWQSKFLLPEWIFLSPLLQLPDIQQIHLKLLQFLRQFQH